MAMILLMMMMMVRVILITTTTTIVLFLRKNLRNTWNIVGYNRVEEYPSQSMKVIESLGIIQQGRVTPRNSSKRECCHLVLLTSADTLTTRVNIIILIKNPSCIFIILFSWSFWDSCVDLPAYLLSLSISLSFSPYWLFFLIPCVLSALHIEEHHQLLLQFSMLQKMIQKHKNITCLF